MNTLSARILFLCLFAPVAKPQDIDTSYTIQYTGRTFGYARVPDDQVLGAETASGPESPAAQAYTKLFAASAAEGPILRLGMGDNFAPNFFGRTYKITTPAQEPGRLNWCLQGPEIRVPKDRFVREKHQASGSPEWICTKDRPDLDDGENTSIDYDNVAQFFIANRYNALVPGKHDFYFGAQWLRDAARLLAENNVHMLGANLAISTTRAPQVLNTYPRIPERYAGLPYGTDFGPVSVDLPDMVFPYKQQFVIRNARQVLFANGNGLVPRSELSTLARKDIHINPLVADVEICGEAGNPKVRDPLHIPLQGAHCMKLLPAETACAAQSNSSPESTCKAIYKDLSGRFDASNDASPASPDEIYLFADKSSHLDPNRNYLFCARLPGITSKTWTCKPFSVQEPLLGPAAQDQTTDIPGAGLRMPFELVESPGLTIAVFGVVDPDLLSNVGLTNYSWLNKNEALDTAVNVAPADDTLQQVLELCNATEKCRTAHKIVMAQMSWARAGQLIARFGAQFDLAISQADDDHDTGNIQLTGDVGAKTGPRLLLTPPNPAPPDSAFIPRLSSATLMMLTTPSGKDTRVAWSLQNRVDSATPVPDISNAPQCSGVSMTLASAAHSALAAADALPVLAQPQPVGPSPSDDLRDLALHAMRTYRRTDIALLQSRDLYRAAYFSSMPIPQCELQNQLQRIFWKGDFVIKLHVTGATLRKIMKQSKKFAALDRDSLSTEIERGRDLLALGIYSDPQNSDAIFVNGSPLDDATLYSVAATEYLGLGDTGYADLATPDVPPPYRLEDFENLRPIAGLVCTAIKDTQLYAGVKCDEAVLGKKYFDPALGRHPDKTKRSDARPPVETKRADARSSLEPTEAGARPFDETPGFDAASHYKTFVPRLTSTASVPTTGVNGAAQQRSFLAVNLENLDVAYTGTYINHVKISSTTFAGITAPGVTTTGSNSVSTDHRLRLIYDFRHGTFYGLSESSLVRSSTSASSVVALTTNMVAFEGGGTIRLKAPRRPSWLSFQYATRFEGLLTDPSPTKVSSTFFLPAPQVSTLSGRLGLRIDHADTYVEAGLEEADSRHILTQYRFSDGTICTPSASLQLAWACPNSLGQVVSIGDSSLTLSTLPSPAVKTADFLTGGAYLNFIIKFPLWSRRDANRADQSWYFTLSNRGDFYFNSRNDTVTQTRYLDKLTPALSIPVYGKLALTPKVDFILYENKVLRNHFRAVSPALSLSYSFRWREGMNLWRALGYGGITTTSSTAGSLPQK